MQDIIAKYVANCALHLVKEVQSTLDEDRFQEIRRTLERIHQGLDDLENVVYAAAETEDGKLNQDSPF